MAASISPQHAMTLMSANKALLVDVREPDEYRSLRIKEAHLLPLSVLPLMGNPFPAEMKDQTIVFFCRSGGRTKANEALLDALAPGRAHIMEGGILDWEKAGLPVIAEKRPWPIMRQVQATAGGLILMSLLLALAAPGFLWLTAFIGAGLVFSGVTGFCGLARLLALMPWNKPQ